MRQLSTPRLLLRQWRVNDYDAFARLNADSEVMRYFPQPLSRQQSDQLAQRAADHISRHGWGLWALEERQSGHFIGFTGLTPIATELAFSPAIEIGWRLARPFWGKGLATEAALQALRFGFEELGLDTIVSFTALSNQPSIAVMARLGMSNTHSNFQHSLVAADDPLCEHVLYRLTRNEWASSQ
ncbi:GNAT family N-acetyltransferase [Candidatus Litorirhabdus singularis]|uniref:GNAT family N-acetyltransferase n=1 Tax=Candidatus Litorirhabdus singularis TaxID=2518993 RepID=UPI00242FF0D7|nr:GNAT family N-acetyltransferase [Candidatus Litorirhabdus singularis]